MFRYFLFVFLLIHLALAKKHGGHRGGAAQQKWLTLSGERPVVVARGGFSGLFPESSEFAYNYAHDNFAEAVLQCDVQLTKDGLPICKRDLMLDNSTNIATIFPKGQKTYEVNGESLTGWFSIDFTQKQIFSNVTVTQSVFRRTDAFDGLFPMYTVDDLLGLKGASVWLNVQYDTFYKEHNLNVGAALEKLTRLRGVSYISSPEIGFLKGLKLGNAKPKIIFKFLDHNVTEPTTKKTYSSLLHDLASIKAFASGILVPKEYIWPVNDDQYLVNHTNIVADAHKLGLEVYAGTFANDYPGAFNYSYDPTQEYLHFIDNSEFAVDGIFTDYPPTALQSLDCFAHYQTAKPDPKGPLIISHNGASGVYPGSTDLAYQEAIDGGADVIDCMVQMSQDGHPFCLESADITQGTTAATTFMARAKTIPEIQSKSGIFSFDLSWTEIQTLKPQMTLPTEATSGLPRNPAYKNSGKLMSLADFLTLAKTKAVSGVLINIKNAGYLASKKGLDTIDAVDRALKEAELDKQVTQKVMIESDDTSVLAKFKGVPSYEKILTIDELIGGAPKQSIDEIKKFANSVNIARGSVMITQMGFTKSTSPVVDQLQGANVTIYLGVFRNEYTTLALDFYSDPIVELSTYGLGFGLNGVITDYPSTASEFKRSPCISPDAKIPIAFIAPGDLLNQVFPPGSLPPSEAPEPQLEPADVVDPPLPPVVKQAVDAPPADTTAASPKPSKSGQSANVANLGLCLVAMGVFSVLSLGY